MITASVPIGFFRIGGKEIDWGRCGSVMFALGLMSIIRMYFGIRLAVMQPMMEQAKIARLIEELRLKPSPILLPAPAGTPGT
jgi:hypothetical protein